METLPRWAKKWFEIDNKSSSYLGFVLRWVIQYVYCIRLNSCYIRNLYKVSNYSFIHTCVNYANIAWLC